MGKGNPENVRVVGYDAVNNPPHYSAQPAKCVCGKTVECIQVTEHMSFCVGNAVKYLWRADHKGNDIEDLRKAAWYINREIERREKEGLVTIPDLPIRSTEPFGW